MSISCKCLNIVVKLVEPELESAARFDFEKYLTKRSHLVGSSPAEQPESLAKAAATTTSTTTVAAAAAANNTTPSDDHFLFFKEALGPLAFARVQIQFDGLQRKVRLFDEWDLSQCRNCDCYVYARNVSNSTEDSPSSLLNCLVNSNLVITESQMNARMAEDNYSPVFGLVLNGSSLNYSDLTQANKAKALGQATTLSGENKHQQTFVHLLRAYMERETEAANERIHRFTEQEFAVLKLKRERAEQDCLILSKLVTRVPEHQKLPLHRSGSSSSNSGDKDIPQGVGSAKPITAVRSNSIVSGSVSPMATSVPNVAATGSQLETPPPTPEYQPMSTGNSPPMTTTPNNGGIRTSVSANLRHPHNHTQHASSMTPVDQNQSASSSLSPQSTKMTTTIAGSRSLYNRTNISFSNNNNTIISMNNTRGAINNGSSISSSYKQQHSSTNSTSTVMLGMTQQQQQQQRLAATNSFESDCMFDIDGMENDNNRSPLSTTLSDEEEFGFDESIGNNNDDGMHIPSRQLGRQNSASIAKSLPISMPQVMAQYRANEEDFDEMNEDNVDIAASIKALARSVHGDTVFGDLPRPQIQRFTTQI
ncbi:uncharacterized protein LOC129746088 [Uranotaenia lowii]|uniref:uncharacterized protein LOC129746088 n=1 Tax=Uranotaenia lowii TaxID=190385 RepID=UPI00247A8433|nr:uncharacterized protein LOC129746088 [Uranotaenia lowii]